MTPNRRSRKRVRDFKDKSGKSTNLLTPQLRRAGTFSITVYEAHKGHGIYTDDLLALLAVFQVPKTVPQLFHHVT
jgi:hypothetical protein